MTTQEEERKAVEFEREAEKKYADKIAQRQQNLDAKGRIQSVEIALYL